MSKFVLSKAMGAVPDDMLLEAMEVKKKSRPGRFVLRAAACLAVVVGLLIAALSGGERDIISMPGAIKVYACDADDVTSWEDKAQYELQAGVDTSLAYYIPVSSIASKGIILTFEMDTEMLGNAPLDFEVFVNKGTFSKRNEEPWTLENNENYEFYLDLGNQFQIQNGDTIYWRPDGRIAEMMEFAENQGGIFADIIVKSGDHLVGYMVIEIRMSNDPMECYMGFLVKADSYPMVDGEYQEISEEYVRQQIEKCHQQDGGTK